MTPPDPRDRVEIDGIAAAANDERRAAARAERTPAFLAIWFRCCHSYGRLYRNVAGTRYEGRCPRCGARVGARIGRDGSARRIFEAG